MADGDLQLRPAPPDEGEARGARRRAGQGDRSAAASARRSPASTPGSPSRSLTGSARCGARILFAALAFVSLPSAIATHNADALVSWISQTFLQLVLLSVIIVGQNVLAARPTNGPRRPTTTRTPCSTRP